MRTACLRAYGTLALNVVMKAGAMMAESVKLGLGAANRKREIKGLGGALGGRRWVPNSGSRGSSWVGELDRTQRGVDNKFGWKGFIDGGSSEVVG